MAKFYLTATSAEGQRETKAVKADSLAQARQKLIDRGWTDIVIHTDDVVAINQIDIPDNPFSPEEMVRLGSMSQFRFFLFMLKKLYSQSLTTLLIAALALAFGILRHDWWGIGLGSLLLLFPTLLAVSSAFGNLSKQRYDALVAAAAWYRWDDVERLLPLQSSAVGPEERAYRAGQILAGRGDIQGAIQRYRTLIARHNVPPWFSRIREAVFYLIANKVEWAQEAAHGIHRQLPSPLIDDAIRAYEEAIALAPEQAVAKIDLAKVVLKYRRDARRARELLNETQDLPAAELALSFAEYVRGIIALEENAPDDAIKLIRKFQKDFGQIANPDAEAGLDESRSFLTLAYSAAGQEELALAQFRKCEPRLIATHELELLARCRQALGLNQR